MIHFSWKEIEEKWQKRWEEAKIFETSANSKKQKFFITVAFPYLSGMLHVGHGRTYTIPDVIARFKRMQGYNVLFPMGWHITGAPIIGISQRIKERDEETIRIYKNVYHVPEEIIHTFEEPVNVVDYFMKKAKETFKKAGFSIDWSREFYTTSLHPWFNRFVEWQFLKLKEKGLIVKGSHRVRWDPVVKTILGDHDLMEGEDVQIVDFVLIKFQLKTEKEKILFVCATLRPETIYGVTNLWLNPSAEYVKAKVNQELWIISRECAEKLKEQDRKMEILEKISPSDFFKKSCINPVTKEEIPILPASFVNPCVGTGVVMSVPAHAPYDYIALKDLEKSEEYAELIKKIKPISLIQVPGYGDFPAMEECEKLGISSQKDKELLEKATKNIYKIEYHKGIFKIEPYKGKRVSEVKEKVTEEMKLNNIAEIFYDFAEDRVLSRFGNKAIVKIIHDQWFIDYSNPEWKRKAKECLEKMKILPESRREQFEAVIEWLEKKACARKVGLGTFLPWDKEWVIESLSDSTIYMAYYTISKVINKYKPNPESLKNELFDYIFTQEKNEEKENELCRKTGLPKEIIREMKEEFEYWYPLDWRTSGKDLVPNHLTFFIFNHVAIFPQKYWPKGIAVNGFGTLEGEKMSKSRGNVLNFIDALEENGSDVTRLYIMSLAEHDNDFDWKRKEVGKLEKQLRRFFSIISKISEFEKIEDISYEELEEIDKWLLHKLMIAVKNTTDALEEFKTKSAVQNAFYSLLDAYKWYEKRTEGRNDEKKKFVLRKFAETWVKLMAPFTPFICEELWERLGNKGFVSIAKWPEVSKQYISQKLEEAEKFVEKIIEDIREIEKILGKKPEKITLYTAKSWKYEVLKIFQENEREALKILMQKEEFKKLGKKVVKFIEFLKKKNYSWKLDKKEEIKILENAKKFIEKVFDCKVFVIDGDFSDAEKAEKAIPGKPGIKIESSLPNMKN